jgi:hypothetical protein
MTGYQSKRAAAQNKLDHDDALTIAYQSGYYDGKKTAQRPWVGLTDEDLKLLSAEWRIVYGAWMDDFARDIETKLKEKNT